MHTADVGDPEDYLESYRDGNRSCRSSKGTEAGVMVLPRDVTNVHCRPNLTSLTPLPKGSDVATEVGLPRDVKEMQK